MLLFIWIASASKGMDLFFQGVTTVLVVYFIQWAYFEREDTDKGKGLMVGGIWDTNQILTVELFYWAWDYIYKEHKEHIQIAQPIAGSHSGIWWLETEMLSLKSLSRNYSENLEIQEHH